jgi:TonB-linked SusC/RagA family outer membrane protein
MTKLHTLTLLLCLLNLSLFAQRMVQGRITDDNGSPIVGANVLSKGTTNTVSSNETGEFRINLSNDAKSLIISYIGYETQEVTLGTSSRIDLVLKESTGVLNDVVVTALGISRSEKSLGYATQQIKGDELTKSRDANIVSSLAGRFAGVQITGGSGTLGGSSQILIRGIRSINGANQPLFVVDGIPMDNSNFTTKDQARGGGGYDYGNALQDINPNDIESVNVLKGQSATALYGSRGANGVVLISLKKGGKQKNRIGVSLSTSLTYDQILVLPKYQNDYGGGVDLIPLGREDGKGYYKTPIVQLGEKGDTVGNYATFDLVPIYGVDESWGVKLFSTTKDHFQGISEQTYESGGKKYLFPKGIGTDQPIFTRSWNSYDEWDAENYLQSELWESHPNNVKDFFEVGRTANTNVAFEGGTDKSSFRLSLTNFDQKGIYPGSHTSRNTASLTARTQLSKKLTAFATANLNANDTKGRSGTGYTANNIFQNFNQWYHRQLNIEDLKAYKNPDGTQRTWNRKSPTNAAPNYWDNPYWTRFENYQTDRRNRTYGNIGLTYEITEGLTLTGRFLTDRYNDRREERTAKGGYEQSKYVLSLYEIREDNRDLILNYTKNINSRLNLSAFVGGNQMSNKSNINRQSTRDGLNVVNYYSLLNSVGNINILEDYKSIKKINSIYAGASFGFDNFLYLDITSRNDWSSTLPKDNNSYFYPSASLSFVFSEKIKSSILSFGKARLGWAKVGNDTDPYNLSKIYNPGDNFGAIPTYTVPNTLNNSRLTPEQTTNVEAGLDVKFFKNRIGLDLTVYTGKTTNQIIPIGTSAATGYSQQFINAGLISNKGIEVQLTTTPIKTTDFTWDIGLNFARNLNKIVELNADDASLLNVPLADAPFSGSLNAYEGRSFGTIMGYDFLRDAEGNKLTDGKGFYLHTPSFVPIADILPKFTGGTFTRLSYKGLFASALVDFKKGGAIFSTTNMWGKYSGIFAETAEGDIRTKGKIAVGKVADLDAEGNPKVVSEGDPKVQGDETYASTGKDETTALPGQYYT